MGWDKAWSETSPAEGEKGVAGCKDSLNVQIAQNACGRVFRVDMVTHLTLIISPLTCCVFERSLTFAFCAECGAVGVYLVWCLMHWTSWNR